VIGDERRTGQGKDQKVTWNAVAPYVESLTRRLWLLQLRICLVFFFFYLIPETLILTQCDIFYFTIAPLFIYHNCDNISWLQFYISQCDFISIETWSLPILQRQIYISTASLFNNFDLIFHDCNLKFQMRFYIS